MSRIAKRTGLFLATASIALAACGVPQSAQVEAPASPSQPVSIHAALAHEFAVSVETDQSQPVSIRDALAHEFGPSDAYSGVGSGVSVMG